MDGQHDLGGLHGFGALDVPRDVTLDEPTFHEAWEGRIFGLMIVTGAKGVRSGSIRPHIEAMPPERYLGASYYERWAFAVEHALVAAGIVSPVEIDARLDGPSPGATADPEFSGWLVRALQRTREPWPSSRIPRFAVGDRVTVRRMAPVVHHRCPRYVRGVTGEVVLLAGDWARPDGDGEAEPLYTVRFAMADLWGADAEPGWLHLDLWEGYLE